MIRSALPLAAALLTAATLMLPAPAAQAQGVFVSPPPGTLDAAPALTGKRARIERELRAYGIRADVSRLSNRQVSLIDNALHGGGSTSRVQSRVQSILRPGLLQRTINRF